MQEALINSLHCTMAIADTGFREPYPSSSVQGELDLTIKQ